MKKKALIFDITGQNGSYLVKFLIKKNYQVHGVKRRSSSFNSQRIEHFYRNYQKPSEKIEVTDFSKNFIPHFGNVTDSTNVIRKNYLQNFFNVFNI
jgi:GDPmannose 4,6-dehydratase